jgi:hypothetical protein
MVTFSIGAPSIKATLYDTSIDSRTQSWAHSGPSNERHRRRQAAMIAASCSGVNGHRAAPVQAVGASTFHHRIAAANVSAGGLHVSPLAAAWRELTLVMNSFAPGGRIHGTTPLTPLVRPSGSVWSGCVCRKS